MSSTQPARGHAALRRGTAAAHHALDHHPLMQRLTRGDLTRESYAEALAAMYRPHARLEREVHGSGHHSGSGLGLTARVELLEADLSELGWGVPPVSHTPPSPSEARAAWWGRVYVLEGSRRGGAIIARCVHATLGTDIPSRFFDDAQGPADRDVLSAMRERDLEGDTDLEQAVASARAAFAPYMDELQAFGRRPRNGKSWPGERT